MFDLQSLGFKGQILTTSSPDYDAARDRYPKNAVLKPSYIAQPATVQDIPLAIKFALSQNPPLELAVKGGGVSPYPASSSDGGLVIDLSHLKAVKVADDKQSVSVGGGALWSDVYAETDKHGVVPIGGNVHFLGVGGVTLAGGYSNLSGKHGLGVDNILQATVVLADGRVVTTSEKEEPDLFWAIRGGVNQFGVVAELVLKTYPLSKAMTIGAMVYPGTELQNVLAALHKHLENHHPSTKMILMFARAPPDFYPGLLLLPYIENDATPPDEVLAPFRELVKPIFEGLATVDGYLPVTHGADQALSGAPPRMSIDGALFGDLWDDVVGQAFGSWVGFTEDPEFRSTIVMWELGHRDKIVERKVEDMAFAAREKHYYMAAIPRFTNASGDAKAAEWVSSITSLVRTSHLEKTGKALITPPSFALSPQSVPAEKIWGDNLPKLRKLKAKYDPKKVWSKGWCIEPDPKL
ncbi:hypothetical protein E1B28_013173 [Marasmius oreades]|uniref:FAD-binding PCMH-type domain-containing protein n=1 Tax=Marasmius oreades TaxID=181124 RepID=A0A9P7RPC3_9AGAR|nr:uncharacterized protein E1B28_013173 [Marasmius oreades]KAG7087192.1 hypothetical protein E1B28_013173 [Marasmius oreades]